MSVELKTVQPRAAELGQMPITVLMNARSGSNDKSAARAAIDNVLRVRGRNVQMLVAQHGHDLQALAQQAADTRPGILVAAGGDGTLNTVASVAYARQLPFAVIPLGTFNYFARELGIPPDAASAALVIDEGCVRRVPVGQINGRLFLNNASIGLYRRLIENREVHKKRFGRNRLVALVSALVTLLREPGNYRLRLEIDGRSQMLSSSTVFFGRNALQMEQLGLDEALCVARGELAVLAPREADRRTLLKLAVRGAFAQLESAQELEQHCASKVYMDWLDGKRRRIRVALDGESVECALPLVVEAVPDALQVIVPRQPESAA